MDLDDTLRKDTHMFERFTDRARHAVVLAQEEARELHHNYIGTEHLLLGLLKEDQNVAAEVLKQHKVSLEAARAEVEKLIGRGQDLPTGHIPFTPRHKKVLELALREAQRFEHNYIGPEHLFLALEREGSGLAIEVLRELEVNPGILRRDVIAHMRNDGSVSKSAVTRSRYQIERDIESHEATLEVLRDELKRLDETES